MLLSIKAIISIHRFYENLISIKDIFMPFLKSRIFSKSIFYSVFNIINKQIINSFNAEKNETYSQ
jgi:hypothetical protein